MIIKNFLNLLISTNLLKTYKKTTLDNVHNIEQIVRFYYKRESHMLKV